MPDTSLSKRYQHSVSRFYLHNFANENGALYAYRKAEMRVIRSSARQLSGEDYLFDAPHEMALYLEEGDIQQLENIFEQFEQLFSTVVKSLISRLESNRKLIVTHEGKHLLFHNDRGCLAWFIVFQLMRMKDTRHMLLSLQKARSELDPRENYDEDFAGLYQGWSFLDEPTKELVDLIERSVWRIGLNVTSDPLYTSDCPVVLYGPSQHIRVRNVHDFFAAFDSIYLPVTPRIILTVFSEKKYKGDRKISNKTTMLTKDLVAAYNELQVRWSLHEVYSGNRGDFALASKLCSDVPAIRRPDTTTFQPAKPRKPTAPWSHLLGPLAR